MTVSGYRGRLARALIHAIRMYQQMISPMRPPCCRFTPTGSQYAVDALSEHGVLRGGWLSLVRLIKCGPWHSGGWDPIPQRHPQADDDSQPEVSSTHV
jgi:uncharacterized protein